MVQSISKTSVSEIISRNRADSRAGALGYSKLKTNVQKIKQFVQKHSTPLTRPTHKNCNSFRLKITHMMNHSGGFVQDDHTGSRRSLSTSRQQSRNRGTVSVRRPKCDAFLSEELRPVARLWILCRNYLHLPGGAVVQEPRENMLY